MTSQTDFFESKARPDGDALNRSLNTGFTRLLVLIATLQGLSLLFLYRLYIDEYAVAEQDILMFPLWAVAVVFPTVLLLGLEPGKGWQMFRWAMGYSGVIALLAFYLGSQVSSDRTYQAPLVFIFVSGLLVASFKALMYMQQQANGLRWSYPVFFSLSWRNFLVLGLSLLFVLATFLVLLLWQGLFNAIGIDFFEYLFFRDWFLFPILGFAFGIGVVLFR